MNLNIFDRLSACKGGGPIKFPSSKEITSRPLQEVKVFYWLAKMSRSIRVSDIKPIEHLVCIITIHLYIFMFVCIYLSNFIFYLWGCEANWMFDKYFIMIVVMISKKKICEKASDASRHRCNKHDYEVRIEYIKFGN